MCGVYPDADVKTAGDEISSTNEGRYLTFLESELYHPYHADGYVDKGDPVVAQTSTGKIVGVAMVSASAATDKITIDTEGIWALKVYADTDEVWDKLAGEGAIVAGDQLFIDHVSAGAITAGVGACGISKRRDASKNIPFGYALGAIDNEGEGVIAVKVHNQGSFDLRRSMGNRAVVSGGMGWSFFGRLTDGHSEGLAGYVDGTILGTPDGSVYNFGSWLCIDDEATMGANVGVAFDTGIYSGAAQAACTLYFAGQAQAVLAGAPAALYGWRLNTNQTIDALFNAANPGSIGFVAGAETATYVGSVPFVNVSGAVRWIRLYDGSS
jgi:hypothetical protein